MIPLIFTLKKFFRQTFGLGKKVYGSAHRVHSTQRKPGKSGKNRRKFKNQGGPVKLSHIIWSYLVI